MSSADRLIDRARQFAIQAHAAIGHRRKYTQLPYDVHLANVATIVSSVTEDAEMIAAAWLHDVVEDTPVTLERVESEFGKGVAELVESLTDVSKPEDGNRATRKTIDRKHLAHASSRAKTVKLADIIDNAKDISKHDPAFAEVYLAESKELLRVLKPSHPELYDLARRTLRDCKKRIRMRPEQP